MSIPRHRRATALALAILALCGAAFWLRADHVIGGTSGMLLTAMVALIVVVITTTAMATLRLVPGWKWLVVSPLTMAAVTWLALFALRPFELYFYPAETITPLLKLGYDTGDLSRTVAIVGVGCATWSAGFLIALELMRSRKWSIPPLEPLHMRRRAAWLLIAVGGALSAALFMRQGGFSALVNSPGALHEGRSSGFYGQLGTWMLIGVCLYALAVALQDRAGRTEARRVLTVAVPVALLSTLALGARGLVVFGLLSAGAIYLRFRTPSRRAIVLTVALAILVAAALEFVGGVRSNGNSANLETAVSRTFHTPVTSFQTGDLSTFDELVAMQQLVPSSISWLHGSSLLEIPAAFAPRALWPGKPQPLDNLVSEYLEPGAVAGMPITMQGEMFWNFGMPGVAVGALLMGMFMAWWMKLLLRRDALSLMLYAVLYPSTFALLTRAIGTMTANTFIALVGVGAVVVAMRLPPLRVSGRRLRWLGTRI